jgi:hypothetical protein
MEFENAVVSLDHDTKEKHRGREVVRIRSNVDLFAIHNFVGSPLRKCFMRQEKIARKV